MKVWSKKQKKKKKEGKGPDLYGRKPSFHL